MKSLASRATPHRVCPADVRIHKRPFKAGRTIWSAILGSQSLIRVSNRTQITKVAPTKTSEMPARIAVSLNVKGNTANSSWRRNAIYHATEKRVRDLPITLDKLRRPG